MKQKYKTAIVESEPYMIVFIVIGLACYLNALIEQDSITLFVAIILGYVILTVIIFFELMSLILLKVKEVEIGEKDATIEIRDKKIEELEAELIRQKNRG